jgi:DNA-binding XRE family transcriptional regulator
MTKKLTTAQRIKRDLRIHKLYASGKYTHRSLAAKVGISKTRVGEILIANIL